MWPEEEAWAVERAGANEGVWPEEEVWLVAGA